MDQFDKVKVLVVDDKKEDYLVTADLLSKSRIVEFDVDWISTFDAAIHAIGQHKHDVYIFDSRLGKHDSLELLQAVIDNDSYTPVILFSGLEDREIDIKALKAGASDYLVKGEVNEELLERSIRYAIERKQSEKKIKSMAYYDILTGLPNRVLFKDRLKISLANAKRYDRILAVLTFDLDNFKRINDSFGHDIGDKLVKRVGNRIIECTRDSDTIARQSEGPVETTVARQGGDEFTLLLTEIKDISDAARVAQRLVQAFSKPFELEGHEVFTTASIGIAIYPQDGEDADMLLKNADTSMYHAKGQGKNNYQFYKKEMNAKAFQKLSLETNLRRAIEREEFMVYYQPLIDIQSGRLEGAEALIRWQHPDLGMVSPGEFIPLAEEAGLIDLIGEWVLEAACMQNKIWQEAGYAPIQVAVNLSCQQFEKKSLINTVKKALDSSGLDPAYLELEITESLTMQNVQETISILKELSIMGLALSLDDFGTGYSSLSHLKRFPLTTLKIDRSFVRDILIDNDDATITKVIISMAKNLNLKVVAEGIEEEGQLQFLYKHGCNMMQGFLVSPPVPAEVFAELLSKEKNGQGIGVEVCQKIITTIEQANSMEQGLENQLVSASAFI